MAVAAVQGADQHIRSSLEFSILPKDTLTCRPGESNQQPFNNKTPALSHSHLDYIAQFCTNVDEIQSDLFCLCRLVSCHLDRYGRPLIFEHCGSWSRPLSLFCSSSQLQHTILFSFITSLHISLFLSWQLSLPTSLLVGYFWLFLSLLSAAHWNPAVSFCIWMVWAKCLQCQVMNRISITVVSVIGKTIHANPFSQVSPIFHFPLLVLSQYCSISPTFPSSVQHAF